MKGIIICTVLLGILLFIIIYLLNVISNTSMIDKEVVYIVEEYIKKEYEGNKDFLLLVSGDKLRRKIASGQIIFPNNHKLDKILSINILEKIGYRVVIRATISAYDSKDYLSNYYEIITLQKEDGRWIFVDVERDH